MAVKRSQRMAVVVDINKKELDKIAQQLEAQQQQLQQEEIKLQQLEDYAEDYVQSIRAVRQTNVQQMQRQRSFVERMSLACKQQNAMLDQIKQHVDSTLELWKMQSQKLRKLEELVLQYKEEEEQLIAKNEQKQIDDLVTQRQKGGGFLSQD